MNEPYRRTNALIWGAVAAILAVALWSLNQMLGTEPSENELLRSPVSVAAVSFFWGWVAGNAKNWYGKRINRL